MLGARRWLYIAHRWSGIVLCVVMALWFVSGVVMMYVGYPKLTPRERLAHLPDLVLPSGCCVAPAQALAAAQTEMHAGHGGRDNPNSMRGESVAAELRLAMIGPKPYWLVREGRHGEVSVDAISGLAATGFDAGHALEAARRFAPSATPRIVELLRQDIFTVSRALDPYRPLYRVALDDEAGSELYVSTRTGEVVRDSTRFERGWNYSGAILHWLYPLKGELLDRWRADVIIYLSLAGTVLALLGIWIGLLRWRFTGTYRTGSRSPYRGGWMRWHHLSGLIFGLITLTWIFSGLMSMNPWKIFESGGLRPDLRAIAGVGLARASFALSPSEAMSRAGYPVREVAVRLFEGEPYYVLHGAAGQTRLIAASKADSVPFEMFGEQALRAAAARSMPGYTIGKATLLQAYDNYYYDRRAHTMSGHIERRLPMLRVEFDDPNRTWLHLDPYTGAIHSRLDDLGRVKRWLFNGLHSFDLRGFIDARPLWDISLILLSAGGCILCISGTVIGWRRLRRPRSAPATAMPLANPEPVTQAPSPV